jgi:hypothetical protein
MALIMMAMTGSPFCKKKKKKIIKKKKIYYNKKNNENFNFIYNILCSTKFFISFHSILKAFLILIYCENIFFFLI